jgi:Xaa-Pro aminopeptidase
LVKTSGEVAAIERTQRAVEESFEEILGVLRRSRAIGGRLRHRGEVVTSESLRAALHRALLERGCLARNTIVACGDQGCEPHLRGTGPIRPGRTIIFDIFPRSETSRYFADMTRTVVKGRASPAVRRLFEAVREGQALGVSLVRAGVNGRAVDGEIRKHFEKLGYRTERRNGGWVGYFHGTGHGVGLDIHEAPWLLKSRDSTLPAGAVVTVEPGLYYPGVGGVRIEDMVLVTKIGCRNLTRFPKALEV